MDRLPIDAVLPDLIAALRASGTAVLQAPPGAGKTTRVPLAMLQAGITLGKILMLEPRRIAARTAADRMAKTLGEEVGQTIGYRIRGEAKVSKTTRVEVVTEGILTRMLQSDPDLPGIGAVIFDEFHERALNADLGLALVLEVRGALREDLHLVVMSATLDADPVAALIGDAPLVTSQGRAFPVETRWLDAPRPKTQRFEAAMADLTLHALSEHDGSALVFLPGEGEIRRVQSLLDGKLPADTVLRPLYGAMPLKDQRAAIAPCPTGRKVVLATAIAETSLTIEDVRIVIDGGRSRRARFDPASGMSRLVTERVTKAEAEQRRGRAGRVAEGVCYRLWTKGEEGALAAFPPAEIEAVDLSALALELAQWGAGPSDLAFLTPPPDGAYAEAVKLLQMLGALDDTGRITGHGTILARLPLHPRLAHMLAVAGPEAADLAALLSDRDPLRGAGVDLSKRIAALRGAPSPAAKPDLARIGQEARRLRKSAPRGDKPGLSLAEQAALAYPDRIGLRRPGDAPRWLLSAGKGAKMDEGDALAGIRLLVVTDLDGDAREARIRQAIPITESELRGLFADQIGWHDVCDWSKRDRRVSARQQERLGALVLQDRIWKDAPDDALALAALDGVRQLGLQALNLSPATQRLRARVALFDDLPDMSDDGLLAAAGDWLLPFLGKVRSAEDLKKLDPLEPLKAWLGWDAIQRLDALAPPHITTPTGRKVPVDYSGDAPEIAVKLQEMFGETTHPGVGPKRIPVRVTLLSPAGRPVATTSDLPGFWAGAYTDVRKDMRGRYPRHPWPEDPTTAAPTLRAKPRGT